jgi:site-specific recombinase XerD
LLHWLSQTNPEGTINQTMQRFAPEANLISPRTELRLVINARRFRFSIATHMAEEGASVFHIAEVFDHSDTQNVRVYVETVPRIADPVAKATDEVLGPLVRRFQGRIIDSTESLA